MLRRDRISEEKEWCIEFQEQPLSLALSKTGDKIAIGFQSGIEFVNAATRSRVSLPTAIPKSNGPKLQVDSQATAFSACGNYLVVATREAGQGTVSIGVHDLPPLPHRSQRLRDLRIPVGV